MEFLSQLWVGVWIFLGIGFVFALFEGASKGRKQREAEKPVGKDSPPPTSSEQALLDAVRKLLDRKTT